MKISIVFYNKGSDVIHRHEQTEVNSHNVDDPISWALATNSTMIDWDSWKRAEITVEKELS